MNKCLGKVIFILVSTKKLFEINSIFQVVFGLEITDVVNGNVIDENVALYFVSNLNIRKYFEKNSD